MFPANTTPEQEAYFAKIGHQKAIEALLDVPKVRGIHLREKHNGYVLNTSQKGRAAGLILFAIAGVVGYFQYHTWGMELKESVMFHQLLWGIIGIAVFLGTIASFLRLRIRFRPDGFVFSQPIFGIGISKEVYWEEIKAIGHGVQVTMTGTTPLPESSATTGGYEGVIPFIKVKTGRGTLKIGSQLSEPKREYVRLALVAYTKAWRSEVNLELRRMQDQPSVSAR
jgi:hypothetical protein